MATILEIVLSNALVAAGLAVLAFAVSRLWRRPAAAHALWLLVLLKLITPPLCSIELPWPEASPELAAAAAGSGVAPAEPRVGDRFDDDVFLGVGEAEVPSPALETPVPAEPAGTLVTAVGAEMPAPAASGWQDLLAWWPAALLGIWGLGSLGWFALLAYRIGRFQRLLRFATPAPAEVQDHAQGLAERLGLSRSPTLWMVPGAVSPMLWGIVGRPRLLIPTDLWNSLDWSQRGALLAHELAHFRRRDHWVRGLELAVTGLYWWHPVVWWARHELREAEEQCCDAWVLWALPAAAQSYARALVETMDFLAEAAAPLPAPASGFGHVHHLKRRLTMILKGSTPRALTWAGGLCVLGLAALLLPIRATWAQPQPPESGRSSSDDRRPEAARGDDRERDLDRVREEIEHLRAALRRAEDRLAELLARSRTRERAPEEKPRPPMEPKPTDKPGPPRGAFGGGGFSGGGGLGGGRGMSGMMMGGVPANLERRLGEVEKKLERLMEMMERMRPGAPGGGAGDPPPALRRGERRGPDGAPLPTRNRDPERRPGRDGGDDKPPVRR